MVGSILNFDGYVLCCKMAFCPSVPCTKKSLLGCDTQGHDYDNWPPLCSCCAVETAYPHWEKHETLRNRDCRHQSHQFTEIWTDTRQEIGRWTHPNTSCYERPFQTSGLLYRVVLYVSKKQSKLPTQILESLLNYFNTVTTTPYGIAQMDPWTRRFIIRWTRAFTCRKLQLNIR